MARIRRDEVLGDGTAEDGAQQAVGVYTAAWVLSGQARIPVADCQGCDVLQRKVAQHRQDFLVKHASVQGTGPWFEFPASEPGVGERSKCRKLLCAVSRGRVDPCT